MIYSPIASVLSETVVPISLNDFFSCHGEGRGTFLCYFIVIFNPHFTSSFPLRLHGNQWQENHLVVFIYDIKYYFGFLQIYEA